MRFFFFLGGVLVFCSSVYADLRADFWQQMDERLVYESRRNRFRGVVWVARGADVLFRKAYGQSIDDDSLFRVASITKTYTAAAVLSLVEKGLVSLDDPIVLYVPQFKWKEITVRQVLLHAAGLRDWGGSDGNQSGLGFSFTFGKGVLRLPLPFSPQQIVREINSYTLLFRPGKSHAYSNAGYALLGVLIEKVSGLPYSRYIEESFLRPLKLYRSGFDWEGLQVREKLQGHLCWEGWCMRVPYSVQSQHANAGGAMFMSLNDLHRWLYALQEGQVLGSEWLQEMETPQVPFVAPQGMHGLPELRYQGLGVFLGEMKGQKLVSHSGGIPGFSSVYYYLPESDLYFLMAQNLESFDKDFSSPVFAMTLLRSLF